VARITFEGNTLESAPGESVLDCLLRAGYPVPNSCRAGACRSCLLRAVKGTPPPASQAGLRASFRERGDFLACQAVPEGDLEVAKAEDAYVRVGARVESIMPLSPTVLDVRLKPDGEFPCRAGQFLNLIRPEDNLTRSYSIAAIDVDGILSLHVRIMPEGRMSRWLADVARPGTRAEILGPDGECHYVPGHPGQELILAGTGTGLAPLFGILHDALRHGHAGPIRIFHGALTPAGLYHVETLRTIAGQYENVSYYPCVLNGDGADASHEIGPLDSTIARIVSEAKGHRAFLCGDPAMVRLLRRKLFLSGVAMADIHADSFLPAATPATAAAGK
jgi:NAD(P)H-flavin reductase/ferredoxin